MAGGDKLGAEVLQAGAGLPQEDRGQAAEHPEVQDMGVVVACEEAADKAEGLREDDLNGQVAEAPPQLNIRQVSREYHTKSGQGLLLIQIEGGEAECGGIASRQQRSHGLQIKDAEEAELQAGLHRG